MLVLAALISRPQPRSISQSEFAGNQGFGEHVAIHHVKAAELEHDTCFMMVSQFGLMRFGARQAVYPVVHTFQDQFWCKVIISMFADLLFMTSKIAAYLPLRFVYVFNHLLPKGEYI
jgi:hypothetical protein